VLKHYPEPNLAGSASNFSRTGVEPDNQDIFDVRLDRALSEKHRVFGRYTYFRDADTPVNSFAGWQRRDNRPELPVMLSTRGDGIATSYDWTISPNTLNQARFGYTRRSLHQTSLQNSGHPRSRSADELLRERPPGFRGRRFRADRARRRSQQQLQDVCY
jgi:lipopolysaccharide assembly outer membrane protein LptD (OstA)